MYNLALMGIFQYKKGELSSIKLAANSIILSNVFNVIKLRSLMMWWMEFVERKRKKIEKCQNKYQQVRPLRKSES